MPPIVEPSEDEWQRARDRFKTLMEDTVPRLEALVLRGAVKLPPVKLKLGREVAFFLTPPSDKPNLVEVRLTHEGAHGFTLVCEGFYEDEEGNRSYTERKPKRLRLLVTDANRMAPHLTNLLDLTSYLL